jgi:membrane protein
MPALSRVGSRHAEIVSGSKGMNVWLWVGRIRRLASDLLRAGERFDEAEAYRLAASLSFYTLSSLFPLLLVLVSIGDIVLGDSTELRQSLIRLLDVTDSPTLRELIIQTLQGAAGSGERSTWGITVGLVGAALGASGIFIELDAAMSKLFRVRVVRRTFAQSVKRFIIDRGAALVLVAGTSLLLLFSVVVLSGIELVARHLRLPEETWPGALTQLGTLALLTLGLALCYRVIPNVDVPPSAAVAGGLIAALGFSLVRLPLSWAMTNLTRYSTYGVVGALLVLVTWFYVGGCILLYGAAFTALRQANTTARDFGTSRSRSA